MSQPSLWPFWLEAGPSSSSRAIDRSLRDRLRSGHGVRERGGERAGGREEEGARRLTHTQEQALQTAAKQYAAVCSGFLRILGGVAAPRPPRMQRFRRAVRRGYSPAGRPTICSKDANRCNRPGSNRIGSDRTGSTRIVSDRIGPNRIEPNRIGSNRIDSDRTGSMRIRSDRPGPNRIEPDRTGSNRVEPDRIGSTRVESDRLGATRVDSDRTGSNRIDSDRSTAASGLQRLVDVCRYTLGAHRQEEAKPAQDKSLKIE
eukprot:13090336-Alexandrium_andersonii.AAC.1